jgi:hypothetical protein
MERKIKLGLTAAAFMACSAGAASAATFTGTYTLPSQTSVATKKPFPPPPVMQTFAGFGALVGTNGIPSNAVLTDVKDTIADTLNGTITVMNTGSSAGSFSAQATDKTVKAFGTSNVSRLFPVHATTVGALFTGTLAGHSTTSGPSSGTSSKSFTSVNPTVLSYFDGTSVTAVISGTIGTRFSIGFSGKVSSTGTGSVKDTLSYSYTYSVVPAPVIGRGLPVALAAGGLLFGAKLVEGSKKRRST